MTDHVAHVRMVRPLRANSMIPAFWYELPDIVGSLSVGSDARVILLSAEGRHFSSGMDVSVFGAGAAGKSAVASDDEGRPRFSSRSRASTRQTVLELQHTFSCLEESRLPVIAAIQGACIGGGVDMVSACDIRYATADAYFTIQEINIGMTADVGTLQRLPRLLGEGLTRELAFTGRRLDAVTAAQHGFVSQVFDDVDEMLAAAKETAKEIAARSPMAIWGTKRALNYSRDHSVADGLEYIATWNAGMLDPDDMTEAFAAIGERRPADYPDHRPISAPLGGRPKNPDGAPPRPH
ncbi:MAG TPA: crotonase/enoyl-CoA hydratase family protein [Acidimicrobiaceae bacterium]|nr:crotonase/enoyl-CoA hydratase family protein [Acidimicrobiaceae bacterium]